MTAAVDIRVHAETLQAGTLLWTVLLPQATPGQCRHALGFGFQAAAHYSSGLAFSAHGADLLLTAWLPGPAGPLALKKASDTLEGEARVWRTALGVTPALGHADAPPSDKWQAPNANLRLQSRLREKLLGGR
ncbi:hypothetical protein OOT46_03900 [Aquabacterium sp. A7-Y]|uniref:hypothetical protein n=1 Tax=Aquabacterium sp. A7-Y TaxID=1349605 RepID=UPI00223E424F|nr:hypothetical protein [Aquabacterium sp. A7-Y]MCW7536997.1 hypothetical protein [Aquabacterium sp. A7-Y]